MERKNKFSFILILTIIITRVLIYLTPRNSLIYQDQFHHIYYGFILLIVYFFIKKNPLSYVLLAVSLGLITDQVTQVPFYLTHLFGYELAPIPFWDYWSTYSLVSTGIITLIIYWKINRYLLSKPF